MIVNEVRCLQSITHHPRPSAWSLQMKQKGYEEERKTEFNFSHSAVSTSVKERLHLLRSAHLRSADDSAAD